MSHNDEDQSKHLYINSCFKQARAEPAKKKAKKPRVESPRVTEDERSDDDLYYSTSARRQAEEDKENKRAKKNRVRESFRLFFAYRPPKRVVTHPTPRGNWFLIRVQQPALRSYYTAPGGPGPNNRLGRI